MLIVSFWLHEKTKRQKNKENRNYLKRSHQRSFNHPQE